MQIFFFCLSYLGELQAEGGDLDLAQPPQGLQSESRGAAGQELDERQEAEVIITDEELEQDVQGAGEDPVRHGHADAQQPRLEHIHVGAQEAGGTQKLEIGFFKKRRRNEE